MTEIPATPENDVENTNTSDSVAAETMTESAEKTKLDTTSPDDDVIIIPRNTINYIVVAVVFFGIGLLIGGMSFGSSSVDEAAIEVAVENVLVDAGLIQPPADMDVLIDDDPFLGPEDAPIVIVEFSAYACPYCGRHFEETLAPLLENYGEHIRYVYRDFPSINSAVSVPAALAANCAREQGMFWEYHNLLFGNQQTVIQEGETYMTQLAGQLGLDMTDFGECVSTQRYILEVNEDFNAGVAFGVSGTPAFYINGQQHSGARPYAYFESIVRRELDQAGIDY